MKNEFTKQYNVNTYNFLYCSVMNDSLGLRLKTAEIWMCSGTNICLTRYPNETHLSFQELNDHASYAYGFSFSLVHAYFRMFYFCLYIYIPCPMYVFYLTTLFIYSFTLMLCRFVHSVHCSFINTHMF